MKGFVRFLIISLLIIATIYGCVNAIGPVDAISLQENIDRLQRELAQGRKDYIADFSPEERKKEAQRIKKEKRRLEIEKQFSVWNGAHRNLQIYIKENMSDPDSYEHVDTKFNDKGTYLIVLTKFRGKNAFGATVTSTVKAEIGLNGKIWSIIE